MTYFSLHNTLGTDYVDPATALANNWTQIDSKLAALDTGLNPVGSNIVSPEVSLECVSSQSVPPNVGAYNGTSWQGIDTVDNWGAFVPINLPAGYSGVTGWTPSLRISDKGRVQLKGRIQYGNGSVAWPAGWLVISDSQFASAQYAPGSTYIHNMIATPTGTTTWAYGQLFVSNANGFLKAWVQYVGSTLASNNYISLNDAEWWAT